MTEPTVQRKHIEWKLYKVMADKKIKSIAELKRRLEAVGIDITSTQLGRMHYERPSRFNLDLLEGLGTVLDCEITDIMDFGTEGPAEPPKKKKEKSTEKPPAPAPVKVPVASAPARQVTVGKRAEVKTLPTGVAVPPDEDRYASMRNILGPRVTAIPINRKK